LSPGGPGQVTERFLTVRGLQLCVEDRGRGPAVLLAHGMWCDAGMFTALAQLLARQARVLVPDLRAHGRSDVPAKGWSIADVAEDLDAMLDQLGVGKVVLAGFSMGGMAAVEFALRHPDRLAGLALIGTSAAGEELIRKAEILALARLIDLTGPARFLPHEASRATFSPEFRRRHPKEIARWESVVRAMPRAALSQALRAVAGRRNLLEEMFRIRGPVVIVVGGRDSVVRPKWSRAMHRQVSGSRLVVYPNTGHAVPTERPGDVAELIEQLLPRDSA
jgi:3-oxoadipate enol-lactonase